MRSEEHTSELQSRRLIAYAVFCLDSTSMAAHKAADPVAIAPLALLILGTVQLHVSGVVPKALFAECGGRVWFVHKGKTLG